MEKTARRFALGSVIIGLILIAPLVLGAATITVTTFADGLDGDGDCSLREALVAANTDTATGACIAGSGSDLIILSAGTYNVDLVVEGDLDITDTVEILGVGSALTSVTGVDGWTERIFDVAQGTRAVFSGMTISGGRDQNTWGGGVRSAGDLEMVDVVIEDNEAELAGGGVYVDRDGSALLVSCRITGNRLNTSGEGIGLYLDSPTTFYDVEVSNHSCDDCRGAGVWVAGVEFSWYGGEASENHANAVSRATIGGALHLGGGDAVVYTISDLWLHDNSADLGGGIHFGSGGQSLFVANSTFENNRAIAPFNGFGGGLRLTGGTTELVNVTLSGNRADEDGGGLYISNAASVSFKYVTLTQNVANDDGMFAGVGGAFSVQNGATGTVTLEGTVMDGNLIGASATVVGSQCADRSGTTVMSNGYNLQSVFGVHPLSCDFAATGDQQGTNISPLDSGLDPNLGYNGGLTRTHALLPGSPALDAIPMGQIGCGAEISKDQRGADRAGGVGFGGDSCDIGTFEAGSEPPLFANGFNSGYLRAWTSWSP